MYIEEEIANNNNDFKIAGGKQGMKVSWRVTGIRKDGWAEAHRVKIEQEKPSNEYDYYLHPDLYGKSSEKSVEYARYKEQKDMDSRVNTTVQEIEKSVKDMKRKLRAGR